VSKEVRLSLLAGGGLKPSCFYILTEVLNLAKGIIESKRSLKIPISYLYDLDITHYYRIDTKLKQIIRGKGYADSGW